MKKAIRWFIGVVSICLGLVICLFVLAEGLGIPTASYSSPEWSADGSKILFLRKVVTAVSVGGEDSREDLYVMDADGKHLRRLAKDVFYSEWSPVENKIAFIKVDSVTLTHQLVIMKADGSDKQALTTPGATTLYKGLSWSPQGDKILCGGWIINVNGSEGKKIGLDYGKWSPDGTMILAGGLAIINVEDAKRRYVIKNAYPNTWSPDSAKVAYANQEDKNIYAMDVKNGKKVKLAEYEGEFKSIAWSPDGAKIAFLTCEKVQIPFKVYKGGEWTRRPDGSLFYIQRGGKWVETTREESKWDIFVMNADGSGINKLASREGDLELGEGIIWISDSKRIKIFKGIIINTDGTEFKTKNWPIPIVTWEMPDLSSDGTKFVHIGMTEDRKDALIFVTDIDGANFKTLLKTRRWWEGLGEKEK